MKGNNIVVACAASGIATSPFCAYRFRSTGFLFDGSLEDWFVSALKGEDGSQAFWLTAIACAVVGLSIGLLLKRALQSVDHDGGFTLTILRTPIAAAILAPFGIATILLVAHNHTLQVFEGVVWPEFYFKNWLLYSVAIALVAAILAGLLNVLEHAFDQATLLTRAGILCVSPLAICVGLASMAGMIGCGLLGGTAVGQLYGCPTAGAWTGVCLAVVVLAVEGGVFWPAYFPITRHGDE